MKDLFEPSPLIPTKAAALTTLSRFASGVRFDASTLWPLVEAVPESDREAIVQALRALEEEAKRIESVTMPLARRQWEELVTKGVAK